MRSRKYEQVLRRDWTGLPNETDQAYATINHKEFFAELSVAYMSVGYTSLDGEEGHTSSAVTTDRCFRTMDSCSPPPMNSVPLEDWQSPERQCWNVVLRLCHDRNDHRRLPPHCNKFFPFTESQLRRYDPTTWSNLRYLWDEIGRWKDPDRNCNCCNSHLFGSWFKSWGAKRQTNCRRNSVSSVDSGYSLLSDGSSISVVSSDFSDTVSL